MGRRPTSEAVLKKILELHRSDPKPTQKQIAVKAQVSLSTVSKTVEEFLTGYIDEHGCRTLPLFPECFKQKRPKAEGL
jgi:predicted transcriptional regulator